MDLDDIDDNKAPGPDGFSSHFFKASWNIVGDELCKAVKNFFKNGKLLKEVNSIVIFLVPKIPTPRVVSDYRPIACCNVVYKIISKVIVNRIKSCLGDLLMRGYHLNRALAKCAFKVDICKAYDSVEWKFLDSFLRNFRFHRTMIRWIMECVSSTSFSINVNGDLQGSQSSHQKTCRSESFFQVPLHFKDLNITHLCFADDLMLCCHGDCGFVAVLKKALDEFGIVSGLLPSLPDVFQKL
ncbi:RNA-directed DNA polymerase, eukaryota, reverse transcriptase zinc-binding domain protein [Tanacetum coccineum]